MLATEPYKTFNMLQRLSALASRDSEFGCSMVSSSVRAAFETGSGGSTPGLQISTTAPGSPKKFALLFLALYFEGSSQISGRTTVASRAVVTLWTKRGLSDGSHMSSCIVAPMRCAAMTSCANDRAAAFRISLLTVRTYALSKGCNWAVIPGGTNASSMFGRASWLQSRKCRQQWTGHKSINMMNFLPCTLSDLNWQISCNVVTDIQRLSLWKWRHQSGGGASGCTREVFPPKMSCADTSPVLETTSVNVMTLFWSEPRNLILSLASVIFAQPDCESMSTISAVLVQIENAFWRHSCLHSNQTIFLNNVRSSRSSTSSGITHVVMCVLRHFCKARFLLLINRKRFPFRPVHRPSDSQR